MKSNNLIITFFLILLAIGSVCAAGEDEQQPQGTRFRHLATLRGGKIAWIVIAAVGASTMITVFLVCVYKFWYNYIPGSFTPGYVAQKV